MDNNSVNEKIFNKLYSNVKGHSLSWEARNKLTEEETKHIIYGEFKYNQIIDIFSYKDEYIKNKKHFCDLGSGVGRICFEIALEYSNFKSITGIEYLKEMHKKSNEIKNEFMKINANLGSKINFINNDFFKENLNKYDLIFMHYPMKDSEELYLKLEEKMAKELRQGTLIISMIRQLRNIDTFSILDSKTFKADYGNSTAYFHIKQ